MSNKLKGWLFGIAFVCVLMIPIVKDYFDNKNVEIISYNEYVDLTGTTTTGFSLVYFGAASSENYNNSIKESLTSLRKEFEIPVKTVDYEKLTEAEVDELNQVIETDSAYMFIVDGEIVYVSEGDITLTELKKLVDKYYNNIIPEDEIAYKTAEDYTSYMNAINSKKVVMSVYGRNSCGWCNKFKPIYNYIAADYNLDIYYFDSDSYDKNEYTKILNSGLKIPASCTNSKTEELLSSGFGTPLTLFTKNGKVIDCISGYVNKDTLISKLKSVGMIK